MERGDVSLNEDVPEPAGGYGEAPAEEAEELQGLREGGEEGPQVQRELAQRCPGVREAQGGARPREEADGDGAEQEGAAQTGQDVRGRGGAVHDPSAERRQEGEEVITIYLICSYFSSHRITFSIIIGRQKGFGRCSCALMSSAPSSFSAAGTSASSCRGSSTGSFPLPACARERCSNSSRFRCTYCSSEAYYLV